MRTLPARTTGPESIGIEALMVRAYREKKIDRLPADPRRLLNIRGPQRPGSNVLSRGERVDTGSWGANAVAQTRETMARLHDAGDGLLAAHDLVLSLDDYYGEDHDTDDLSFSLWTKDGALDAGHVIVEAEYGDRAYIQAAELREEAGGTVAAPIAGARQRRLRKIVIAPLIVLAGRAGEAPYVSPIEIERERAVWCPRNKRRIGFKIEYVTPIDVVMQERMTYAAWHHALSALAAGLADAPGLTIAPPCLPARPWECEAVAA